MHFHEIYRFDMHQAVAAAFIAELMVHKQSTVCNMQYKKSLKSFIPFNTFGDILSLV